MNAPVDISALPDPYAVPLDSLDVSDPRIYHEDAHYRFFERLRQEDPVHYTAESPYGPYWSVTKYKDIIKVEVNHQVFSSSWEHGGGITLDEHPKGRERISFIRTDAPKHDEQRKVVTPAFAPVNLAKLESLIRGRTEAVLDALPRNEVFDWVPTVSINLTSMMLATLFDYPLDQRHKLIYWSDVHTCHVNSPDAPVHSEDERYTELYKMVDELRALFDARAKLPPQPDLVSMLAHGEAFRNLSDLEFMGQMALLINGGNDTTRNSMSGGVWAINRFPDEFRKVRENPALIDSMVSEVVRWHTPVIHMRRTAIADFELRGKTIKAGDKVAMWYISANRDDEVIDRPNDFIVDRARPREHISFGFGIHRCLGNRLAELQLRVLWQEIVRRDLRIEAVGKPVYQHSNLLHGIKSLLVRVH